MEYEKISAQTISGSINENDAFAEPGEKNSINQAGSYGMGITENNPENSTPYENNPEEVKTDENSISESNFNNEPTGATKDRTYTKTHQTAEINAEFARKRREEKRLAELKSAKEEAVIEALGGINPFTGEQMKDSADVEEYLTMKKLSVDGKDPLKDFLSFRKEAIRQFEQKEKQNRFFREDAADFFDRYPDADIEALAKDESFLSFSKGKVGKYPLAEIYSDYLSLEQKFNEKAKKIAAQSYANMRATPGSLTSGEDSGTSFYTPEQVDAMSQDEVLKNYDKIRESMKKWQY